MALSKIRPKRGTKTQWTNANTLLVEGELGVEVPDEGIGKGQSNIKIGDGSTSWNDLPYAINIEEIISKAKEETLNACYPIGKLWWSEDSTNPGDIVGGTWEQVKDVFILAAGDTYEAGSSGGEATHTLTVNEMPSHYHLLNQSTTSSEAKGYGLSKTEAFPNRVLITSSIYQQSTTYTGGNQPHNNMPPYETKYCFKRIA